MFTENDYRQILKGELEKRCAKNARYSLRAFARDLGMGSARLSEVLNGKGGMSREKAESIADTLAFGADEKEYFCNLVESAHARSPIKKELATARLAKFKHVEYGSLEIDHFKVISDWYHFAILELTEIQGFKSDPRWIALALGIQEIEAKLALERLVRLGFLELKRKRYVQTKTFLAVSSAIPAEAIRKFHRQILQKALEAIDLQKIDQRDLGAMTMTVHLKDVPRLKEKIKTFRKELNQLAQATPNRNSVYCFSTQLFELTNRSDR